MKNFIVRYTECRRRTVIIEADSESAIDDMMRDSEFFNNLEETHIVSNVGNPALSQVEHIRPTVNISNIKRK
jgi:hypothetical protein